MIMSRSRTIAPVTDRVTRQAAGDFARHLRALGRSKNTVYARCYWIRRICRDCGTTPWTLTPEQVEQWLADGAWSRATRRMVLTALHQFYSWAEQPDPAAGLGVPRQVAYRARPIPDDALAAGLEHATGIDWWLLRVLATTGLRRAELAGMTARDVQGPWLIVRGKGGRVRRVPLAPDVAEWLAGRGDPIWPGQDGRAMSPGAVAARVRRLTGYGPHAIRHRYATRAYAAGHDLAAVQRLLGHASIATTQQYLAVSDDELVGAARLAWAA